MDVPAVANDGATAEFAPAAAVATAPAKMGCIFKVGDDIRQDVLAIQVSVCSVIRLSSNLCRVGH